MKLGKIVKTAIKWAPVAYPIIKKILDDKKQQPTATRRKS
ncbi:hypothetical protein [Metasolibacillus sp.]|nr:hypothetical protein [Metasolibacillus sp.]MCT6923872.1 hypothetical protein [Metasolibacillus sp.]MCT6940410.1 hypothetical protein [Metasolibacillus sp.]